MNMLTKLTCHCINVVKQSQGIPSNLTTPTHHTTFLIQELSKQCNTSPCSKHTLPIVLPSVIQYQRCCVILVFKQTQLHPKPLSN